MSSFRFLFLFISVSEDHLQILSADNIQKALKTLSLYNSSNLVSEGEAFMDSLPVQGTSSNMSFEESCISRKSTSAKSKHRVCFFFDTASKHYFPLQLLRQKIIFCHPVYLHRTHHLPTFNYVSGKILCNSLNRAIFINIVQHATNIVEIEEMIKRVAECVCQGKLYQRLPSTQTLVVSLCVEHIHGLIILTNTYCQPVVQIWI